MTPRDWSTDPNCSTNGGTNDNSGTDVEIRTARSNDYESVVAFTRDTWPDHEGRDYIPRIYREWIAGDDGTQRTFVADAGDTTTDTGDTTTDTGDTTTDTGDTTTDTGDTTTDTGEVPSENVVGIVQGVLLSDHEAWSQGMRVAPDYRGRGLSRILNDAVFEWAAGRGAVVCRNMVFSWNRAGLGGSRAAGFEPAMAFRWAHPEPSSEPDNGGKPGGDGSSDLEVVADPDAAWHYWTGSEARDALGGLALDLDESWAVSELTLPDLRRAAEETALFALQRGSGHSGGTRGLAYRVRDYERESTDGTTERWAEYGVGAWADVASAQALFGVIARDAATLGADRTRVLIPETPRHVTDVAVTRTDLDDGPDFVLEADLSAW